MNFNVLEYFEEAGISYTQSGKNISQNWIGINCPFCDDTSNHCGVNVESKMFSCWRCGSKGNSIKLIMGLENKSYSQIIPILKQFESHERKSYETKAINGNLQELREFIQRETEALTPYHRGYLQDRNFDPIHLERTYQIRSFKPVSKYKHRIFIPYLLGKETYTFTTRDVSGHSKVKYVHCPIGQSIQAPKELLYNVNNCKDSCMVVEGCFDVFRIGSGSVALSGIQYTTKQLLVLSKFKQVFLLFDPEKKAQEMAIQLGKDLSFCSSSIDVIQIEVDTDPGDMKDEDVKHLKRELLGKWKN
jgi:DNA primase